MRSVTLRTAAFSAVIGSALTTLSASATWSQGVGQSNLPALGIVPGARVRLLAADYGDAPQIGTVTAVRADSIVFHREVAGDSRTLVFNDIAGLDLSDGRHARPLTGLAIGLATGALAGAVVGFATHRSSKTSCCFPDFGPAIAVSAGGALGGAAGGIIGLVTGALIHTERWLSVGSLTAHPQVHVILTPSARGPRAALGISARF